jgi:hypothetical protein
VRGTVNYGPVIWMPPMPTASIRSMAPMAGCRALLFGQFVFVNGGLKDAGHRQGLCLSARLRQDRLHQRCRTRPARQFADLWLAWWAPVKLGGLSALTGSYATQSNYGNNARHYNAEITPTKPR